MQMFKKKEKVLVQKEYKEAQRSNLIKKYRMSKIFSLQFRSIKDGVSQCTRSVNIAYLFSFSSRKNPALHSEGMPNKIGNIYKLPPKNVIQRLLDLRYLKAAEVRACTIIMPQSLFSKKYHYSMGVA